MKEVLKREYPKGVDVVYESVGGDMFETCLNALAVGGRLVVIGMMSQVSVIAIEVHAVHAWGAVHAPTCSNWGQTHDAG